MKPKDIDYARLDARALPVSENGLDRMNDEQRLWLKRAQNRLIALLLQYCGRAEGGEAFLEEGRRITGEYGQICAQMGLTLPEATCFFLFFRRSILAAIHESGCLCGGADDEGQRLFHRSNDFFDALMINLFHNYIQG